VPGKTRRRGETVVIPLHPMLRAILEETPLSERRGYVLPEKAATYMADHSTLSRQIQRHFKGCKISTSKAGSGTNLVCDVGFHSFRHSFVTLCAKAGAPLAVVQALCGHGSPAVQKVYLHMGDAITRQTIRALPAIGGTGRRVRSDQDRADDRRRKALRLLRAMMKGQVPKPLEQELRRVIRLLDDEK
jgi:integrase